MEEIHFVASFGEIGVHPQARLTSGLKKMPAVVAQVVGVPVEGKAPFPTRGIAQSSSMPLATVGIGKSDGIQRGGRVGDSPLQIHAMAVSLIPGGGPQPVAIEAVPHPLPGLIHRAVKRGEGLAVGGLHWQHRGVLATSAGSYRSVCPGPVVKPWEPPE